VLSLDGDRDYLGIPHAESLNPKEITIEVWVKAYLIDDVKMVGKGPLLGDNKGVAGYLLGISNNGGLYPEINDEDKTTNFVFREGNVPLREWTHIAVTYSREDKTVIGYINGEEVGRVSNRGKAVASSMVPLIIGGGTIGFRTDKFWFSGVMDEIRIWNFARTQEEIQGTMNTTLTGNEKGLVGYWNFDDGTANDLSPNGNDGTLFGDAHIVEENLPDEFTHKGISRIVLEDRIANPGDQFTTDISVHSADRLHSFSFDLTFDPSVLKVIDAKAGPFLFVTAYGPDAIEWQNPAIEEEAGVIQNISCSRISEDGISGDGILASVTFEAVDIGAVDLSIKNLHLLSPTEEEIRASAKKAKIKIYPHGSISGVVLDSASGEPIDGARVEVSKDGFAFGRQTDSADDGTYTLNGVPIGDFDVTASKDDYMSETISKVHVEQGKDTSNIDIKIQSFATAQTITIPTPIAVGEIAPDFTLQDINGKETSLSNFTGKPIILNFWDSASEHCRRQILHLDALYKKYQGDGLVVIGITKEKPVQAPDSAEISYSLLSDGAIVFQDYGVTGIPCTYYIDKAGRVRYRRVGFPSGGEVNMEEKIKELLEGN